MKTNLFIRNPVFFTFILLFLSAIAFSQAGSKSNYIYLEAGGPGLFGSINYERQFSKEPGFGLRAGLGFYTEKAFYMTVPVGINYLFPLKNKISFIDAGIGITWAKIDGRVFSKENNNIGNNFTNVIPSIYYRRHAKNNLMWKAGFTPVFNKNATTPWAGIAIGKGF